MSNNFYKNIKFSTEGHLLKSTQNSLIFESFEVWGNCYDYCWWPGFCCFATCIKDRPVQLWDGTKILQSYITKDAADEILAPLSVKIHASSIYCGFNGQIQIFDVNRSTDPLVVNLTPSRKSKLGLKGLITCIDHNPDWSGMYAAASYSGSIGIFDERNHELLLQLRDPQSSIKNGVTQATFAPNGKYLFSTSRNSDSIICWDIRQTQSILYRLERRGRTNQRISFDIDSTGKFLATGHIDGYVDVYNLNDQKSVFNDKIHSCCVSGVAFSPVDNLLASCSGERSFDEELESKLCFTPWDAFSA
jgi:WD40 repeat protein